MSKRLKAVMLMVGVCLLCQTASGDIFTVEDNIAGNVYLSAGASPVYGSFDIAPFLPTGGQYVQPYDVTSAYYTMNFQDDYDSYLYDTSTYWTSTRVGGHFGGHYHYYRYHNRYYYDESERVLVGVEGEYSSDGTNWYAMTSTSYHSDHPYFYYTYDHTQGYGGSLTVTQYLGSNC